MIAARAARVARVAAILALSAIVGQATARAAPQVRTYTVQPGDALAAIGERFCIDYITVGVYSHRMPPGKTIQPGDILVLRPDPTVTWSPDDAYAPPAP